MKQNRTTEKIHEKAITVSLSFLIRLGKSQMNFSGKTINDEGKNQGGIQVYNMRTGISVVSNSEGGF